MARTITKTFSAATTKATVSYIKDGELTNEIFELDGKRTVKAVQVAVRKKLGTKNFFVSELDVTENDASETYTMDSDKFIELAKPCADGGSYGREYVTYTAKNTAYTVMFADGTTTVQLNGTPADSRARTAIAEALETDNFLVVGQSVADQKLYMTRDEFIENATKVVG